MDPTLVVAGAVTAKALGPLVSCILPTYNRASCIHLAFKSYQSQTYPHRELIVVDNGTDQTERLIPEDPTIHYFRVNSKRTTGAMRNLCNERARGLFICHFDSDDWSAPTRVAEQVARIGTHVFTGYSTMLFYDRRDGQAYRWSMDTPLFALGTSFCYRRDWWQAHPFAPIAVGEDARFFQLARRLVPTRVVTTESAAQMVAVIHEAQTSRKNLESPRYALISPHLIPEGFRCALI